MIARFGWALIIKFFVLDASNNSPSTAFHLARIDNDLWKENYECAVMKSHIAKSDEKPYRFYS
jgi:hypothetical protein